MALALLVCIVTSYLFSYTQDVRRFHLRGVPIWRAIIRAWPHVVLSVVARLLTSFGLLSVYYRNASVQWGQWSELPDPKAIVVAIAIGLFIVACPRLLFNMVRLHAAKALKAEMVIEQAIQVERKFWFGIIDELSQTEADMLSEIWANGKNSEAILSLFEDQRIVISEYFFRNRNKYPNQLWFYFACKLCGGNNSKRVEGLVYAKGFVWTKKAIDEFLKGKTTVKKVISEDQRKAWKFKSIEEMKNSPRAAVVWAADIIEFLDESEKKAIKKSLKNGVIN